MLYVRYSLAPFQRNSLLLAQEDRARRAREFADERQRATAEKKSEQQAALEMRQARRKSEMEGLQNALAILEGRAIAFLETDTSGTRPMLSAVSLLRR